MQKLVRVAFEYADGTKMEMTEPRAVLMFQSRCNSNGILSGLEEFIDMVDPDAIESTE
jgi:hypothetical protein